MATMHSVRSWTLPKRKVGSWPAGYQSASIDANSPREAAERMANIRPATTKPRRIEVEDYYGRKTMFTLATDGALTQRRAGKRHGARKHSYKGR